MMALKENIYEILKAYTEKNHIAASSVILEEYAEDIAKSGLVVEVRHGKWKKVAEKYPRYVCTSCHHLYNNKEYKYCPNCGAKMDGKGEGE